MIVYDRIESRRKAIERRLHRRLPEDVSRPVFRAKNIHFEMSDRIQATCYGGIGLIHQLASKSGLIDAIDRRLHLLKIHLPYHESDHVLNLAYNAMCEGRCLEDIELRRNDEAFLNALGAVRIPDPTTAGDFCRRFTSKWHLHCLQQAFDEARLNVWARQSPDFFQQAVIDMDGHLIETTGKCKQGMDIAYDGTWGYHPLLVSLANTGEVLRILNRSGNRPSHEGAAALCDEVIALCRKAGFQQILLRGDTDFSQTAHLDRWDSQGVQFHFGYDATPNLKGLADDLPDDQWETLERPPRWEATTAERQRPDKVKDKIVFQREYTVLRLESEEVAEFDYQPGNCSQPYRMIVIRKNISREKGEQRLFDEIRYFFYLTNDRDSTPEEVVYSCNDRCNQENLIEQLSNGVRAFRAPVDNLMSNWAYMLMTSLAWNLKAWSALWLEEKGRWSEKHRNENRRVLRMEFRTYVNYFMKIPCQIVRTGRKLVYRLLSWNSWLPVFRRLSLALRC